MNILMVKHGAEPLCYGRDREATIQEENLVYSEKDLRQRGEVNILIGQQICTQSVSMS